MSDTFLRVTEIFLSIQGEAAFAGYPTAFVRLTGCPLRCQYCDSEYAFYGGEKWSLDNIVDHLRALGAQYICVTGGEPLAQPNCLSLLSALCDVGFEVSLETSGAIAIEQVDSRVSIVMDLKTPGSGEVDRNELDNLQYLKHKDQLKFVVCDRQDYEWASFKLSEYNLSERVGHIFFSSSHEQLEPRVLANWIIEDRLPVRFQTQLHKTLWGDKPGV